VSFSWRSLLEGGKRGSYVPEGAASFEFVGSVTLLEEAKTIAASQANGARRYESNDPLALFGIRISHHRVALTQVKRRPVRVGTICGGRGSAGSAGPRT
jgi:hypothetical protein